MSNIEQYFDDLERDIRNNPNVASLKAKSQERKGGGKLEVRIYEVHIKSNSNIDSVKNDLKKIQVNEIKSIDKEDQKITIKDSFDKDLH